MGNKQLLYQVLSVGNLLFLELPPTRCFPCTVIIEEQVCDSRFCIIWKTYIVSWRFLCPSYKSSKRSKVILLLNLIGHRTLKYNTQTYKRTVFTNLNADFSQETFHLGNKALKWISVIKKNILFKTNKPFIC